MAYIGNEPGVASQRVVSTFTATAGQTTFTPISGYTLGYIDVYLNGIKLVDGDDYTAANGMTVVLTSGAAVGDSVECVAFFPRGLSDGYLKSEADARYVGLTGDQTIAGVKTFSGSATIVNGNLGVGTSSVLGNSTFNAALGIAVRNQSTSMGYFQTYNANAGSNLKTWRWGGDGSGNLVFETVNDAYSSATNRVTLDASGRLGIGVTSPTAPLTIASASNAAAIHIRGRSDGYGDVIFYSNDGATQYGFVEGGTTGINLSSVGATSILFGTNGSERARIDSNGKLLVGGSASDLSGSTQAMVMGSGGFAVQYTGTTGTYLKVTPGAANGVVDIKSDARSGNYPDLTFSTSATERARITAAGQLLVQTTSDTSGMNGQAAIALGPMGIRSFTAGYNVTFDTGIPINQGYNGGTALLILSGHVSDGTSTHSALYLIQFYYNGNNTPTLYFISGWNGVTAGKSASNTLTLYSQTIPNYTIIMCT